MGQRDSLRRRERDTAGDTLRQFNSSLYHVKPGCDGCEIQVGRVSDRLRLLHKVHYKWLVLARVRILLDSVHSQKCVAGFNVAIYLYSSVDTKYEFVAPMNC